MKRYPIRLLACLVASCLFCLQLSSAIAADQPADAQDSFAGHMQATWQALADRQIPEAKAEIAAAAKLANGKDEQIEARRMQLLAVCVERFWAAVDAELKRLVAADELKIDGTPAAVVQSDAKGITLRVEGKAQKYSRDKLPTAWARAIAEHRFDNSAANKLLLGAFLAVEPRGDRSAARKLWENAERRDPNAAELLPLLQSASISKQIVKDKPATVDDDEAPPVAKVDVPDKDDLTAAAKRFKETYGGDVKGAKTAEQKAELAQKLVEAAASAQGPAWQWTLLHEALLLAAGAADPQAIEKVAQAIDKHFNADPWEVNVEAYTRAAAAAKAERIAEVVRHCLQLLDEWEGQSATAKRSHAKAAQKLDQATLTAARRAHDPELVNSVIERKKSTGDN